MFGLLENYRRSSKISRWILLFYCAEILLKLSLSTAPFRCAGARPSGMARRDRDEKSMSLAVRSDERMFQVNSSSIGANRFLVDRQRCRRDGEGCGVLVRHTPVVHAFAPSRALRIRGFPPRLGDEDHRNRFFTGILDTYLGCEGQFGRFSLMTSPLMRRRVDKSL